MKNQTFNQVKAVAPDARTTNGNPMAQMCYYIPGGAISKWVPEEKKGGG